MDMFLNALQKHTKTNLWFINFSSLRVLRKIIFLILHLSENPWIPVVVYIIIQILKIF